jgi:hypothetical protein
MITPPPGETMAPVHVEEVPPPSAADSQITSFLASSIFTSLPIGLPGPSGPRKACSSPCAERRQVEISHGSSVQRRHKFARFWRSPALKATAKFFSARSMRAVKCGGESPPSM